MATRIGVTGGIKSNNTVGPTPGPGYNNAILHIASQPTMDVSTDTLDGVRQAQRDAYDATGCQTTLCFSAVVIGLSKTQNDAFGKVSNPYPDGKFMNGLCPIRASIFRQQLTFN